MYMTKIKNYLLGYEDMYIMQDNEMFNFSLDSVLLPNFVTLNKKIDKVMDIGCGNAPIPLILSTLTSAKIYGVEIQEKAYKLAKESVEINNLTNNIEIINADINEFYKNIESDSFDVITCNPPYFKVNENSNFNISEYKTIARHEIMLDLERLFKIAKKLLKNNIEPKRIQFVHPKKNADANILLIEGTKNGKPGIKILPPLFSHNEDGEYTDEIKKYFEKR